MIVRRDITMFFILDIGHGHSYLVRGDAPLVVSAMAVLLATIIIVVMLC